MTTHIERAVTDVVPTPEPPERPAAESPGGWAEVDRLRCHLARAERLAARTRAEDFDD
jgi:hypothetical protein